jgi:hypothetical protein
MRRSLATLASALALSGGQLLAQAVPEFDDPCRAEVELYLSIPAYSDGLWGSTQLLSDFAWKIRGDLLRSINEDIGRIESRLASASAAERTEMVGTLRAYRNCLPWLLALLGRVERRLKELGANVLISMGPTRERMEREALFKMAADDIARLRAMLDAVIARPRDHHAS